MNLPSAVRKQGERATQMMQESATRPEEELAAPPTEPVEPEEPEALPPEKPQEREAPPAENMDALSPDQLKHRIKTLEGMLRTESDRAKRASTERDRLQGAVGSLSDLVTSLQQQVSMLHQRVDSGEVPKAPAQETPEDSLNPDDFDDYGDEIKALVTRLNKMEVENRELRNQYGEVGKQFQEHQQTTAQQNFYSQLSQGAPDWQTINQREDWRVWLTCPEDHPEPGEVMGEIRDKILKAAYARGDGSRVAQLINRWKADMGFAGTVPNREGLESQVMPGAGGANQPSPGGPGPQHQPVSKAAFDKASVDASQGKISPEAFQKVLAGYQRTIMQGNAR